jgi:heme exporter protein A
VTASPLDTASTGSQEGAQAAGTAMIELRKLTKAFGRKAALRGLDLRVPPGESLVLFGPNGAGKTTLIRILSSLSRPTSGAVYIGGLDLKTHADGIRRHLGVVSHAPLLYDSLTAEENLRFFGRLYGVADLESRIALLLEQVGLTARRQDLVRVFSRGMTQRLSIARALLHDPEILLLDEPDTGLDPQAAEMLHRLLAELSARSSERRAGLVDLPSDASPSRTGSTLGAARTIVTVTHNLERGLALADRIVILANGRIVYDADAGAVTASELRPIYDEHVGGGR